MNIPLSARRPLGVLTAVRISTEKRACIDWYGHSVGEQLGSKCRSVPAEVGWVSINPLPTIYLTLKYMVTIPTINRN